MCLGAVCAPHGIFPLAYGGDGSGQTYVTFAGHRLDAHLAGLIGVALGIARAIHLLKLQRSDQVAKGQPNEEAR